jgi:large subunit ribosomal protein L10
MPVLSGPVVLGFSQEDPGAVARVFEDFVKENEDIYLLNNNFFCFKI